ncbi:hypothetical protein [Saccharothrix texasensis]|uniref:hypothetical protein n=1 Tax=Saccharothrix texasensis TaxID=103734 RepID=UPI000F4BDA9F|nr:hypothetical protein [Saccharothrix texasensis]
MEATRRELPAAFIAAARAGDMASLERLFVPDVTSLSDGEGRVGVARKPVVGVAAAQRCLGSITTWFRDDLDVRWASANGQPCAVLLRHGADFGVVAVSATTEGIDHVLWLLDPEKITAVSDAISSPPSKITAVPGRGRRPRQG